jgi:hypothetical protein
MVKYSTCAGAARIGDLVALKRMHEEGYEWDRITPAYAALNGNLECLKYAHENGCEWNEYTTIFASTNEHLDCFKYCFQEWDDPQKFWNLDFNLTKIFDRIDLDDNVWRRLFDLDLSKYPELQVKVNEKKKEIEEMKEASKKVLETRLPLDIIKYCIQIYF